MISTVDLPHHMSYLKFVDCSFISILLLSPSQKLQLIPGKQDEITGVCKDHQLHEWSLERQNTDLKHWSEENPKGKMTRATVGKQAIAAGQTPSICFRRHPRDAAAGPHSSAVISVLQALGTPEFLTVTFYIHSSGDSELARVNLCLGMTNTFRNLPEYSRFLALSKILMTCTVCQREEFHLGTSMFAAL